MKNLFYKGFFFLLSNKTDKIKKEMSRMEKPLDLFSEIGYNLKKPVIKRRKN